MQDAKLYFREQFTLNGETVLGKVAGFDLMTDWTELSQTAVKYNKNLSKNPITENFSYKNITYKISANQANISP